MGMHKVYLQVTVPAVDATAGSFRWLNWLGHILIKYAEVEIGGQRIDKHYGDWMHIWNELSRTAGHKMGYANMVGNVPALTQVTKAGLVPEMDLYIPLEFWFCRNPGLALPLIALQYHEVKINIEFRSAGDCCYTSGVSIPPLEAASLYVDYIYLDTDERRRFAQVSHEYLIEQVQFTGDESVSSVSYKKTPTSPLTIPPVYTENNGSITPMPLIHHGLPAAHSTHMAVDSATPKYNSWDLPTLQEEISLASHSHPALVM